MARFLFLIFIYVPLSAFVYHPFDSAMRVDSDMCYVDNDKMHTYIGSSAEQVYDLYVGLQPLDSGYVQLGIGVLGVRPQHPIIKAAIEGIADMWYKNEYKHMATARTGPIYFTKKFIEHHRDTEKNSALPSFYFYPLGSVVFDVNKKLWQKAGAYTVHHWAKSWLLPTFRRTPFQSIQNY